MVGVGAENPVATFSGGGVNLCSVIRARMERHAESITVTMVFFQACDNTRKERDALKCYAVVTSLSLALSC